MKKFLVTSVAVAALIASPAFAKSAHHTVAGSYAAAPDYTDVQNAPVSNPVQIHTPYDVYFGSQYLGADPDPQVRLNMITNAADGGAGGGS